MDIVDNRVLAGFDFPDSDQGFFGLHRVGKG